MLDAANALFGQRGLTWEQPFLDTLAASTAPGCSTVDYAGDTEAARTARQRLDRRADPRQDHRDPRPGPSTSDTRLALVDTLYLKAPWEQPFEPALTEDAAVHPADGSRSRCR